MVAEDSSKSIQQEDVNRVWGGVWKQEPVVSRKEMFGNRLFVEGYPVFRKYIPQTAHTILDVGSGSGRYGIRFAEDTGAQVYLTDITDESLRVIREAVETIGVRNVVIQKEDMFSFSFPDNMFDVVFCDVVIQHVAKPEQAIREMLRVLRPGGRLIVSAVNHWNFHTLVKHTLKLRKKAYPYGYEKAYSATELAKFVESCGGNVIARDGFYVAYGIFRLRYKHKIFGLIGRVLNRIITAVDTFTNRVLSRRFGFEVFCVATKK